MLRVTYYIALLGLLLSAGAAAQQSNGSLAPTRIDWPTYTQHGVELSIPVTVNNTGDAALNATVSVVQLPGIPFTWLAVDQTTLSVAAFDQTTFNVRYNAGGAVNNPGTVVSGLGWVILAVDPPTATDSLGVYVRMIVADTVVVPIWDTLMTSCLALTVGSNGNLGHQAIGGANMNFAADCDQFDSIPGDATVYLADASPVVFSGGQAGTWSMYTNKQAFAPAVGDYDSLPGTFLGTDFEAMNTGLMLNSDSTLFAEIAVYAPTSVDSCNFVIHGMRLWAVDGTAQNDLTVGMLLDWDIPSDSGKQNLFGEDLFSNALWQQGREVNEPHGDSLECQNNDTRFGGVHLIGYADQTAMVLGYTPFAAKAAEVASVSDGAGDLDPTLLYQLLTSASQPAISGPADLISLLTVFDSYNLAAGDTLTIWTVIATVDNGSSADLGQATREGVVWFVTHPNLPFRPACCNYVTCCNLMGDVNLDGLVNLSDLMCMVNQIFLWPEINCVRCWPAANASGDAGCAITLTDLTAIMNHLFVTFVPLPDCNSFDPSLCREPN